MRKLPEKAHFIIDGPAGDLEALMETPQGMSPPGCAVICHPHPVHGGAMTNKVTHTLARSFVGVGFAALRFKFRGVGKSAGSFDEGQGEVDDVLAAVAWMRAYMPELPLWLAGFSFGAAMAIRAAVSANPAGLVSIAPAVSRFATDFDTQLACPWLILQGDEDELVDIDEIVKWVDSLDPGPELTVFPGTEHFFHGELTKLRDAVEHFISVSASAGAGPADDQFV